MSRRRPNQFQLITKHPAISAGLVLLLATVSVGAVVTVTSASGAEQTALDKSSPTSATAQGSTSGQATSAADDAAALAAPTTSAASASPSAHASKHGTHAVAKSAAKHATSKAGGAAADTSMSGMVMAKPKPGKWVKVDAAAQKKETAAFFAKKPDKITGNGVRVPEFNAQCTTSHRGKNDPIVFPGQTGKSHDHTFFGNKSTNAKTTLTSLLRTKASSCLPKQDHSSYWVPTVLVNNKAVVPASITVYYGSNLSDHSKVQPFPQGLRMVVGDARNQVRGGNGGGEFYCQGAQHTLTKAGFPTCAKQGGTNEMLFNLLFPECWDGKHLDSPDHKSHMSFGVGGGKCPSTHPVQVPTLQFVIHYPGGLDVDNARLSSGTAYSMHGDFFNAWEKPALAKRVRNCINQSVKCTTAGTF